jgi:hypothetical protein
MTRHPIILCLAFLLPACSSTNSPTGSADAAVPDANASTDGAAGALDAAASTPDARMSTDSGPDMDVAPESSRNDAVADAGGDGACPDGWLTPPGVDPSIAVPADGGVVLVHASASGTQNYACAALGDGGFGWSLVTPQADLSDCHGVIGHHFASEAGATAPEWLLDDGSYAIGHRIAQFVPEGGAASIPWLLLSVIAQSDAGVLSQATHVQRLNTHGGIAPAASSCGADGGGQMVPYSADYYFYGP